MGSDKNPGMSKPKPKMRAAFVGKQDVEARTSKGSHKVCNWGGGLKMCVVRGSLSALKK